MGKRLIDNVNSAYVEAANHLRPNHARRKIVAYVESFDDIYFWRSVLQEFESDKVYFEVMLPSRTTLGKGKKMAMMNKLGPQLGGYMIACVDADYDWLLGERSSVGHQFATNPYIFHTYAYAIENFQCYAPGLHTAVVMSTLNDREIIDFNNFLKEYSRIIWPLFIWSVWVHAYGEYKSYTLKSFCDTVGFHEIRIANPKQAIDALRNRVNKQISWLQRRFPEGKKTYPALREELINKGIIPEDTYLYIHGHTLFENVVMTILTPICAILRKERERQINDLAEHETQRQNELSCYQHSICPVDIMLRKANNYKESPRFQSVKADITRLMTDLGLQK